MVITMTNRLLAVVIALALSSGIAAHAAQAPQRPIAPITVAGSESFPVTLQTAAAHLTETATSAIDPSAAIRDAYQRDHVALERLRQQASALKGNAHPAFNQYIDDQELVLAQTEHAALATSRPSAGTAIAAMDQLVAASQAELNRELSQPAAQKSAHAAAAPGQQNKQQGGGNGNANGKGNGHANGN
jgi:glutamine synthetase adenylyltransferase